MARCQNIGPAFWVIFLYFPRERKGLNMNPTDAQLLTAAKLERIATPPSERAFEAILLRYEKLIHYIARRYFDSREDALDASQEAALKIYNGLPKVTIPEDGSLKPWICTVVARTCLDEIRKNRLSTVELNEETVRSTLPSAEDIVTGNERVQEILTAVKHLPEEYRMVIILRDMQGLSYEEVAKALELNIGTVKSRLARARSRLKKLVDEGVR